MPLSPSQAFTYGFLARCADEGLSRAETESRINTGLEKTAEPSKEHHLLNLASLLFLKAPALGLAGSVGVGAAGGMLAAKAFGPQAPDPEEYKQQELLAQYQLLGQQARERMRRQPQLRQFASQRGPRGL